MLTQERNQISARSSWAVPLAACSILVLLLVISGTIVLALIPIYLKPRDINVYQNQMSFNAIYTSDVTNAQSLALSNTNDLSTQMLRNIPHLKDSMAIQSGQLLSVKAAAKKKRQTSEATISCEITTGLYGDLFTTRYMMKYPPLCTAANCEQRYLKKIQNAIRKNHRQITVTMSFTNGETRIVQLTFCSFSMTDINGGTSNTPSQSTSNTPFQSTSNTSPQSTSNASTYIYLLDQESNFFQFHPTTLNVTFIGTINCSTTAYPYSMAVQRDGKAWTLYTDGNLYTFDIKTTQCQPTSFLSDQSDIILFGMNFATDGSNDTERLYITSDSSNSPFRLATIDLDSLEISIITYYESIDARAELTTTNDGRLFGLFEGTPFTIAEVNRTNGEILSKTSQNMIQYPSDSSQFAFVSYQSNFFLFVGDGSSTNIFLYDTATQTTTQKKTISNGIVGAGLSTCLQDN